MPNADGIFDLENPRDFFESIKSTFKGYKLDHAKDVAMLLYVIMGLNHLCEWIKNSSYPDQQSRAAAQKFYKWIFLQNEYKTIKELSNRTKHLKRVAEATGSDRGVMMSDWQPLARVKSLALGVAKDYTVDGGNVIDLLETVVDFYESEWFSMQP